jgi:uncharacterized protein YndB with AHSA1/START domain
MGTIVLYVVLGIAAVAVLFLIVAALQPAEFRYVRTTTIDAPPSAVFAEVNDFHRWDDWSPWAKLDPNSKTEFSGPAAGEGAGFRWSGNSEVGEGAMKIVESKPPERIAIVLDFVRPMKATHDSVFTFEPHESGTLVTWTMSGKNGLMGKAFGLIVNCDKMLGAQFEKGLASMKSLVEAKQ